MENIAIIADKVKKETLEQWLKDNRELLSNFKIITGETSDQTFEKDLIHKMYKKEIQFLIYFIDPMYSRSSVLFRVAVLSEIPVALNTITADFIVSSRKMEV